MTVGEFKAWLEGFSEAMGSSPNMKQWKKIQERLEMVQDYVYPDYRCYQYWWPNTWYTWSSTTGGVYNANQSIDSNPSSTTFNFDYSEQNPDQKESEFRLDWQVLCSTAKEIGQQEAKELAN